MTPGLDIMTPRGQQSLRDERTAGAIWEAANDGWAYVSTQKDKPVPVDAMLVKDGVVEAVTETKCRYGVSLASFLGGWGGEWLVTMDKIVKGSQVSATLGVPLYGFLYLVDDGVLLTKRIADSNGQFVAKFRCENTVTQRTINGGQIVRANAYIDMTDAREWRAVPTEGKPVETHGCLGSSTRLET